MEKSLWKKRAFAAFAAAVIFACGAVPGGNGFAVRAESQETGTVPTEQEETAETQSTKAAGESAEAQSTAASGQAGETEEQGVEIPELTIEQREIPDNEGMTFVKNLKIGWSLGNTFDAYMDGQTEDEMSIEYYWCGVKTTKEMIDEVKEAGFETIRIPVSWHNHVSGEDFEISEEWMNRVQEVVDYAVDNDMYVILNIHHDIGGDYLYPDKEHLESSLHYLTCVWTQIAQRFRDYDDHIIYESINEPRLKDTSYEWWLNSLVQECKDAVECINEWNQTFVDVVRASGGKNAERYLMTPGYDASLDGALNAGFAVPEDPAGRIIVSVHAYTPYSFALQAASEGGSTNEFSASNSADTADIDWLLDELYEKFISQGQPVLIGEFGARDKDGNLQSRVEYAAYYVAAARARGMSCGWWDNNAFAGDGENFGLLDRATVTWKYPEIVEALMKYADGEND